ncbi:membrane-flanked domain-containing protein [Micromonospora sp. ATCC 39149]|nr:membrane-flanked domain-containing protein [Micromonospora sp. ATCC 39149]
MTADRPGPELPHPSAPDPELPRPPAPDPRSGPGPDGEAEPRRRLHPLSPALHGAKSLVVVVAGLSWSTLSRVGFGWFAALAAVLALGATVLAVVSWYNTGYHVVGRELRVYEGLLWRRTRAIPLERLQAVEVVRPLLAQLTGLAELRLEVVGGGKTEAPLAYLGVADAAALRQRLLALAGPEPQPSPTAPPAAVAESAVTPTPPGRALHAVANRDLLVSQLLTPQAFLLPFGVAFVRGAVFSPRTRGRSSRWRGTITRDGRRAAATDPPRARRLELPAGPGRGQPADPQRPAGDPGADRAAEPGADGRGDLAAAVAGQGLAAAAPGGRRLLRRRGRRPQPAGPAAAGGRPGHRPADRRGGAAGGATERAGDQPPAEPGPVAAPAGPARGRRRARRAGLRRPVRAAHPAAHRRAVRPHPERAGDPGAGAAAAAAGHRARGHRGRRGRGRARPRP